MTTRPVPSLLRFPASGRSALLGLTALATFGASGCARDGDGSPSSVDVASANAAPRAIAPSVTGSRICDRYVATYERCIAKMPEAERAASRSELAVQRKRFAEARTSDRDGDRDPLSTTCKEAFGTLPKRCN